MDNPHQAKPSCQRLVSASPRVCLANTTWACSAGPCAAEPRRRRRWRWRRRCFCCCCCWVCWVRGARTPAERLRRATAARLPSGSPCRRSPVSTAPGAPRHTSATTSPRPRVRTVALLHFAFPAARSSGNPQHSRGSARSQLGKSEVQKRSHRSVWWPMP